MAENENVAPSGAPKNVYCTECGTKLLEGQLYCTECGTKIEATAEPVTFEAASETPAVAAEVVPETEGYIPTASVAEEAATKAEEPTLVSATDTMEAPAVAADDVASAPMENVPATRKSKTPLIIGIVAAVVVVAVIVALVLFFTAPKPSNTVEDKPQDQPEEVYEDENEDDGYYIDVDLQNTFVTSFPDKNKITYPNFAISYPKDWTVVDSEVTNASETFVLENKKGNASVEFSYITDLGSAPEKPSVEDVEYLYTSEFEPEYVQGTDYSDLGDFMVAEVELEYTKSNSFKTKGSGKDRSFYTVLPEKALDDWSSIITYEGVPAFDYAGDVAVYSNVSDDRFGRETEDEIIAILASFRIATNEDMEEAAKTSSSSSSSASPSSRSSTDYILPESSTRLLTKSDLAGMSDYELFVARNEIYARHGRIFQKEELRDHFGSKSWYNPKIQPSDFSESMLSDIERKNVELIKDIEESHNSPYLAP